MCQNKKNCTMSQMESQSSSSSEMTEGGYEPNLNSVNPNSNSEQLQPQLHHYNCHINEGNGNENENGNGKVAGLSLQSGARLRLQHLSAATGLIATYLIEIGVQIFVILHCWRSLDLLVSSWDWSSFLILASILTSLLVTTMSMVWVCRGLDFVGRVCARLLCYVMHFCLLGLLWRYLKLAFAYDHADVQEFVALRIFQAYIQSLPLTSIHLAWLITFREEWFGLTFWMIMVEIGSVGAALIISAYVKSDSKTQSGSSSSSNQVVIFNEFKNRNDSRCKTTQIFSDSLKCSSESEGEGEEESNFSKYTNSVSWSQVLSIELNIMSRMMLLICRLLVLGILLAYLKLLTCALILIHFLITFIWIGYTDKSKVQAKITDEEIGNSEIVIRQHESKKVTREFLYRGLECSYILFWDTTSSLQGPLHLSAWALPTFCVIFENGLILIIYSYETPNPEILLILISTVCLILGLTIFFFLNFVICSKIPGLRLGIGSRLCLCEVNSCFSSPQNICKKNGSGLTPITSEDAADFCCPCAINTTMPTTTSMAPGITKNNYDDINCCRRETKVKFKHKQHQFAPESPSDSHNHNHNQQTTKLYDTNPNTNSSSGLNLENITKTQIMNVTNGKSNNRSGSWDLNLTRLALEKGKPLIMANNYTNISEVLMNTRVRTGNGATIEKGRKDLKMPKHGAPPCGDSPPLTTSWDTCCNDSNGSSNSRNTNTLLETKGVKEQELEEEDEDMVLDNPHFVFYFPEQRTNRNHSVVRKLNIQSVNEQQQITTPTSILKMSRSSPNTTTNVQVREKLSKSNSNSKSRSSSSLSKSRNKVPSPVQSFNSGISGPTKAIVRTSTPVEIKKAARVIMNYPKHEQHQRGNSRTPAVASSVSRCHCQLRTSGCKAFPIPVPVPEAIDPKDDPFYEKLMEDSYGILICEGEPSSGTYRRLPPKNEELLQRLHHRLDNNNKIGSLPKHHLPTIFHVNQKLKVLCAKCLRNHDPLLTNCLEEDDFPSRLDPRVHGAAAARVPPIPSVIRFPVNLPSSVNRNGAVSTSDTTEYPSETEMTWTATGEDQLSVVSSHLSTATYTTWPRKGQVSMSMWTTTANPYPKEFTSREYVRTWLLTSQAKAKHYYNEYGHGASGRIHKVHRSRTISTVRKGWAGGSVGRNISQNRNRPGIHHHPHHQHSSYNYRSLGKRHGPVGRGQSPESRETLSILPSPLVLTPPPKQKQHPVLPKGVNVNVRLEDCSEISSCSSSRRPGSSNNRSMFKEKEAFYKDLEIIV